MLKGFCGAGPGARGAYAALGCDWAYNWTWPSKLTMAGIAPVWPMIVNTDSTFRLADHVLWMNEEAPSVFLANKINGIAAGRSFVSGCKHIVGNFLIQSPQMAGYSAIRDAVLQFRDVLQLDNVVTGFHLYHDEKPASVAQAAEWFAEQIIEIRRDFPEVAITEWGILKSLYRSGNGPDVDFLSNYMRQCWSIMDVYNVYASAWFIAMSAEDKWRAADICLTNTTGQLRELGQVYASLKSDAPPPVTPTETDGKWREISSHEWDWDGNTYRTTRGGV